MNILLRKALTDVVLVVVPFVLQIVTPFNDWLNRIGASTGESALGLDLNDFLLGYSEPPTGPWYPPSFMWCWYVPLVGLILFYHVVDKGRYKSVGTWLLFWLVPAIICAVIAFGVIVNNDPLVPSLTNVGFGSRFLWALFNFIIAALLGLMFTPILASAAVNTRLTPFGR